MTKMDLVRSLVADAAAEIEKIERWRDAVKDGIIPLDMGRPNRQRILDDLRMARRLSLEVEKEARQLW